MHSTHDDQLTADAPPLSRDVPRQAAPISPHGRFLDDPRRKRVRWAALLSLVPGLGQVYVGYTRAGFRIVLVLCALFAMAASGVFDRLEPPLVLFCIFFWLYNVVDAARRATLYNLALDGLRPMDLPDEMEEPAPIASVAAGLGLIAVGLVLFGRTMFGWSLAWVGQWWPMGLVGLGVWLIYANWKAKTP